MTTKDPTRDTTQDPARDPAGQGGSGDDPTVRDTQRDAVQDAVRDPADRPPGDGGVARPRRLPGRLLGRVTWWAGAAVAGAIPALAFPEPGLWPLAYTGLVPLLLLTATAPSRGEAARRGWVGGAGFLLAAHHWLFPLTGPFLVPAVLVAGLPWLAWGALAHRLLGRLDPPGSAPRVVAAAGLLAAGWVVIEAARSVEYLGGPFGLLGSSVWQVPALLAPAALGGVWLVGFLAVAANAGLAAAVAPGVARAGRVAGALVAVAAVAAGPAWSALRPDPVPAGTVRVGVVQVGVIAPAGARFDAAERLTGTLPAGAGLDLVVWGESSVGADLQADPALLGRVQALAARAGAPLLVNVDARQSGGAGIFKRSVLVTPAGVTGTYDKQRLVPFGEHVPLRPVLGWVTSLTPAAAEDRRRGTGPAWLDAGDLRVGPLVCFESAFPDLSRRLAAGGADLLVAQSSTTTFQESWAPEQHASLAAVRAVEAGRPMLHATLSGTTAAFDASGRRLAWIGTDQRGAWTVDIPLARAETLAVRLGDWVPVASAVMLTLWLALRLWRRPRTRGGVAGTPGSAGTAGPAAEGGPAATGGPG